MKGLLTKDFRLMLGQKKYFALIIFIGLCFVCSGENTMFAIAYVTFLGTFFTVSTINYDEFNNGSTFLFTLPFRRKGYVLEKYLFGVLLGGMLWACFVLISMLQIITSGTDIVWTEWFVSVGSFLLLMLVMLSIMLPLEFKFGVEKGRTANILIFGILFLLVFFAEKILAVFDMSGMVQRIGELGVPILAALCVLATVVLIIVSVMVSTKIIEKKQF